MQQNWNLEEKFKQEFIDACSHAAIDNDAFSKFRSHDRICTVIENGNEEVTLKIYELIKHNPLFNGLNFEEIDSVGGPKVLIQLPNGRKISPTTIRYIYLVVMMLKANLIRPDMDIVEIGGGYGGLCAVISRTIGYKSYTIHDISDVCMLHTRFLHALDIKARSINTPEYCGKYDLCISWCAFSELDFTIKQKYIENVISKSDDFFICSNWTPEEDKGLFLSKLSCIAELQDEVYQHVLTKCK